MLCGRNETPLESIRIARVTCVRNAAIVNELEYHEKQTINITSTKKKESLFSGHFCGCSVQATFEQLLVLFIDLALVD
jgi:hypothetical protein